MSTLPAVFVSHGAPDLPLQASPARDFLQHLGQQLGRPKAILAISAHWGTRQPLVSAVLEPQTIHDFGGFPAELYHLNYSAPGAPELANRVVSLLKEAGINGEVDDRRGLDHGAWNPLLLMYPSADIPVTQLSIQPGLNPTHHLAIGRTLEPLRAEGVLVLASGAATHNLRELGDRAHNTATPTWASGFANWLTKAVVAGDVKALLNYRTLAPNAARNHPTEEHLLPLFVALGAGGKAPKGTELHSSFMYGSLSMAAYAFA